MRRRRDRELPKNRSRSNLYLRRRMSTVLVLPFLKARNIISSRKDSCKTKVIRFTALHLSRYSKSFCIGTITKNNYLFKSTLHRKYCFLIIVSVQDLGTITLRWLFREYMSLYKCPSAVWNTFLCSENWLFKNCFSHIKPIKLGQPSGVLTH